jgi:hypothetical protein
MNEQPSRKKTILLGAAGVALAGIIGTSAFYLGTTKTNQPVGNQPATQVESNASLTEIDLKIKGNKSSRIFHMKGCPNYDDIADRNIIWFKTAEEAKARGYRIAKNC